MEEEKIEKGNDIPEVKEKKKISLSTIIVCVVSLFVGALLMFLLAIFGVFSPTEIVASVNGKNYSYKSIENLLPEYMPNINELKMSLLLDAVDTKILNKKIGLTASQEKEIESYISTYVYYYGLSEDYAKKYLTVSKLRDLYYLDYIASNYISNDEVSKYYEEQVSGDIDCEYILVMPNETNLPDDKALAVAKEIIEKINSGKTFEEVANEYKSAEYGQSISNASLICQNIEHDIGEDKNSLLISDLDTEFTSALLGLADNTYTLEPVKTSFGYHIINRKAQTEKPDFASVEKSIKNVLAQDYAKNNIEDEHLYSNILIDLRKQNGFNIFDKNLKTIYDEYCNPETETVSEN